jgi:glucokinase
MLILAGDIGGSNTRLALAHAVSDAPIRFLALQRFANDGFSNFDDLLGQFLAEARVAPGSLGRTCLAVAAPVPKNLRRVTLTHRRWVIDADALACTHALGRVTLINDLSAAAWGVADHVGIGDDTHAGNGWQTTLQSGVRDPAGPRLLINVGTGLGMAVLLPQDGRWQVLPGEAGHTAFAPLDASQLALWRALHAAYGRVSNERVMSGAGLMAIHRFLGGQPVLAPPEDVPDPAAAIAARAALQPDGTERRAMNMLFSACGAFAGDMALALLATGGVYLTGSVLMRNRALLQTTSGRDAFVTAFNAKGAHGALLRHMPAHLLNDADIGLKGAARQAMTD